MRSKFVLLLVITSVVGIVGLVLISIVPNFLQEPPRVMLSRGSVQLGDFFVLSVAPLQSNDIVEVRASFLAEDPVFFRHQDGQISLIPVNYRTQPDTYSIHVEITRKGRGIASIDQELIVADKEFSIQRLTVSPELHGKRDERLWDEDRQLIGLARAKTSDQPLWEGSFLQPAEGRITTGFGQIRFINNVDSGRHSGIDIAAPSGSSVLASNNGIVTLAQELNVTGNTIIIDHGFNLFTSYSHLDQILVDQGQLVIKGEQIGTVGNTGFSTGSHLHWAVVIGSGFVDPYLLTRADPKDSFPLVVE